MGSLVVCGAEIEAGHGGSRVPRHHHVNPYAAVVLRGGYLEAGDCGRIQVSAGDVLFHTAYEGHCDWFGPKGAEILNLPLGQAPGYAFGSCSDPDGVMKAAENGRAQAIETLLAATRRREQPVLDWPDLLASAIRSDSALRLAEWAEMHGLSPETVSRGFRRAYGVSPKRFRLEQRAAAAARAISSGVGLSEIAFTTGFADQPHMTRAIGGMFDCSPARLRAA